MDLEQAAKQYSKSCDTVTDDGYDISLSCIIIDAFIAGAKWIIGNQSSYENAENNLKDNIY